MAEDDRPGATRTASPAGEAHRTEGHLVQIGLLPNTELAEGTRNLSKFGEIVVDAKAKPGSAGRLRQPATARPCPCKQIIIATGEGAKAAPAASTTFPDTRCGRLKGCPPRDRQARPDQRKTIRRARPAACRPRRPSSSCRAGDMYWIRPKVDSGDAPAPGGKQHQRPAGQRATVPSSQPVGGRSARWPWAVHQARPRWRAAPTAGSPGQVDGAQRRGLMHGFHTARQDCASISEIQARGTSRQVSHSTPGVAKPMATHCARPASVRSSTR